MSRTDQPVPPAGASDRGHLETEQRNLASAALDAMSVAQVLEVINTQDMAVPQAVRAAIPQLTPLVEAVGEALRAGGRLIYLGAGTSGRLGVLDASECPPTFHSDPEQVIGLIAGGDTALRRSSEGREDDPAGAVPELDALGLNERDVVVGIAAGGTTPYVWGALEHAGRRGAATGLVTCTSRDQLRKSGLAVDEVVRFPVCVPVGPEVVTGSTRMKAGTATKLVLNMISTTAMVRLGKTWGNLMVDLRASNVKLRDRAVRILTWQTDLPREEATALLERAGGRVKLALVMARLNVDADEAQRRLDGTDGRLRPLLGPPR